jgi:Icc-related predicted phosphoesterase
MTFHLVSDVHGAADALSRAAPEGATLLVLGDLVNLVDYRTTEGIVPDVVGTDAVNRVVALRSEGRYDDASALWFELSKDRLVDIRAEVASRMKVEYEAVAEALERYRSFVTFGNVDNVDMLVSTLPSSATFVDGEIIEIDGLSVGFAGGGVPSIGSAGEVSHEEMRTKLDHLGPVDVLCTHVPPDVEMLSTDVIGGRPKASPPIREYLLEHQPRYHFFGDVHQPRALTWRFGETMCRNVGYFRATGRSVVHRSDD